VFAWDALAGPPTGLAYAVQAGHVEGAAGAEHMFRVNKGRGACWTAWASCVRGSIGIVLGRQRRGEVAFVVVWVTGNRP